MQAVPANAGGGLICAWFMEHRNMVAPSGHGGRNVLPGEGERSASCDGKPMARSQLLPNGNQICIPCGKGVEGRRLAKEKADEKYEAREELMNSRAAARQKYFDRILERDAARTKTLKARVAAAKASSEASAACFRQSMQADIRLPPHASDKACRPTLKATCR